MKTDWFFVVMAFFIGMMLTMFLLETFKADTTAYRQGQIDAMNGKIAFELKLHEDGSTFWGRVK